MQQSRETTLSAPGWVADQWKFWRGHISAGAGPARVPAPMSATGGATPGGVSVSPSSVDSQTYPFSVPGITPGTNGAPTLVVARQPTRSSLIIKNTGQSTLFIFFGPQSQNITNPTLGLALNGGEQYEPPAGVPVDEIYVATQAANCTGVVITGS
jgi:hypothetical protein